MIDELPYLLPDGAKRGRVLTSIQRVMEEERDGSDTTLLFCGSLIGQMRSLLAQSSPLHGRLASLEIGARAPSAGEPLLDPRGARRRRGERRAPGEADRQATSTLSPYLRSPREMRLISERMPVGAPPTSRGRRYRIDDGSIRLWSRFVLPHQTALEEGLAGEDLWDGEISELLPDFVADFEDLCLRYVRKRFGGEAPDVGPWGAPRGRRRGFALSEWTSSSRRCEHDPLHANRASASSETPSREGQVAPRGCEHMFDMLPGPCPRPSTT